MRPTPASASNSGPQTTQFGAEDLARLAAAAAEIDSPSLPDTPTPSSLLAGLPRPRVTSAPSPLTQTDTQRAALGSQPPRPEKASARRTVMGMPLFGMRPSEGQSDVPGDQHLGVDSDAPSSLSEPTAAIHSLDSFGKIVKEARGGPAARASGPPADPSGSRHSATNPAAEPSTAQAAVSGGDPAGEVDLDLADPTQPVSEIDVENAVARVFGDRNPTSDAVRAAAPPRNSSKEGAPSPPASPEDEDPTSRIGGAAQFIAATPQATDVLSISQRPTAIVNRGGGLLPRVHAQAATPTAASPSEAAEAPPGRAKPSNAPPSSASAPARPAERSEVAAAEIADEGGSLSRLLAGVVGLTLIGLFAYPAGRSWFWEALGNFQSTQRTAFLGVGAAGLIACALALAPLGSRARNISTIVMGAAGVACISLL